MSNLEQLLWDVYQASSLEISLLERLLLLDKQEDKQLLFSFADKVRKDFCGDGVVLRGIVEFSNICSRDCLYCGLNAANINLVRYRLEEEDILQAVKKVAESRIKTVVLQSGQDDSLSPLWLAELIRKIKKEFDMAITLSVGEHPYDAYALWKDAGAERYLLKIETSDEDLYASVHLRRKDGFRNRLRCLKDLFALNYQVGSGIIVGLPGQDIASLARDIIFFKHWDFDMIGIGPFIPHPHTPLANYGQASAELTLKVIALTRIVTKNAHIPATTALGSVDGKDYRWRALQAGANVIMPNFTPLGYRKFYQLYPGRRCMDEEEGRCVTCLEAVAKRLGRYVDYSRADSLKQRRDYVSHACQ